MTLRITRDQAYARGAAAAKAGGWSTGDLVADVESCFPGWRAEYPLSQELDYRAEIVNLWNERLDAEVDLTRYPECRGLRELVHAEHQGYLDHCGGNIVQAAYHFNYAYFLRLRLATRYFGFPDELKGTLHPYVTAGAQCSALWAADTLDGPVVAKNLDTTPAQIVPRFIPGHCDGGLPPTSIRQVGTATAAVLCDDEPEEIFPVDIQTILPEDIRTVRDYVPFRHRYRQFCGPHNAVYVDPTGDSVAIEQTNTRMAWRFAHRGISAVTALAYRDPGLAAFKAERDAVSLEKRGWTDDSPDYVYWKACSARYERLMQLTADEAASGTTVDGLARIMLDPDGPLPERISTANESFYRGVETDFWTMGTWLCIAYGDKRRTYRWAQPRTPTAPIFTLEPELILEAGVAMRPEFETQRRKLAAIGKPAA